ncbi:aldo/keto reductase [Micromonospora sp. NPDC092111]|uniref:aldo/keto reductase n=1 Tax=Micromonospora sp. NPDC092111 TaxID=3364289 RepID=UPI0037F51CF5
MEVSVLTFGAMLLGRPGGLDHKESVALVHAALDAGINLVDTADEYGGGESETIVGKALAGRRDDVILATKGHYAIEHGAGHPNPPPNTWGNSRRHIVSACEASLRRLGTDWIDLYQIHYPDDRTSLEETLATLTDLVRAGKIRAFGASNFPAHMVVEAQWVAERRALYRFQVEQFPYSIFVRWTERSLLPMLRRHRLGGLAYSPLDGGWLTGVYRAGQEPRRAGQALRIPRRFDRRLPHVRRKAELVEDLLQLAAELDTTLVRLAVRWCLEHPAVTSAVLGARTEQHLRETLGAEELHLPLAVLDRLDELVPPGTSVYTEESRWRTPYLEAANRRTGGSGHPADRRGGA